MGHPNALSKGRTPFPGRRTPDENRTSCMANPGEDAMGKRPSRERGGGAPALRLRRGCPPWFWPGRRCVRVMGVRRRRPRRTMG